MEEKEETMRVNVVQVGRLADCPLDRMENVLLLVNTLAKEAQEDKEF